MPTRERVRRQSLVPPAKVFLNVPYDGKFEPLYLAYIAGLKSLGLVPAATLEITGGTRRLDRIFGLIQSCAYSIHDLSRVQLDRSAPRTPRFNMPFELGMAVAWENVGSAEHTWFVFEEMDRRIFKSLSDLNGTDAYIHRGTVSGVLSQLCGCFSVTRAPQPTVNQMYEVYRSLRRSVGRILHDAGTRDVYHPRVFRDLVLAATAACEEHIFGVAL